MNSKPISGVPNSDVLSVYTGRTLEGVPIPFFLEHVLDKKKPVGKNVWNLFQGEAGEPPVDFLRVTSNPGEADFLIVPHDYYFLKKTHNLSLVSHFVDLAETHQKKIILFALADSDERIQVPHAIVFRYSQYGYKKSEHEVIAPPYTFIFKSKDLEDYREKIWKNPSVREKGQKPIVSFHGWADFPNAYRYVTYGARIAFINLKKYLLKDPHAELHKPGIYFRRKAVTMLKDSKVLATDFLMRKSFFSKEGLDGKSRISRESVERSYVESILHSDFVLAPKGMGNTSVRFFEALSLGRFPVLVDTDYVFPLAEHIDYSKFVVSVDYTKMRDLASLIVSFYNSLDDSEFKKRQKMARDAFMSLRPWSFFRTVLFELRARS